MKVFKWEYASRISIIFGIIGGIYLLFVIFKPLIKKDYNFESTILIDEFKLPQKLDIRSYYGKITNSMPLELEKYKLAEILSDSLYKYYKTLNVSEYEIRKTIRNSIPSEIEYNNIKQRVDSTLFDILYPINQSKYYIETSLENNGNKIVENVRLEITSSGYFELYENENLIKIGDYKNHIPLGDVRVNNKFLIKIWSFEYINPYQNYSPQDIRYTFNEGSIKPNLKETVLRKGIKYWIFKNTFLSLYILGVFLWLIFNFGMYFNLNKKNELEKTE